MLFSNANMYFKSLNPIRFRWKCAAGNELGAALKSVGNIVPQLPAGLTNLES